MNKQTIKGQLPKTDLALQINATLPCIQRWTLTTPGDLAYEAQALIGVTDGKQNPL